MKSTLILLVSFLMLAFSAQTQIMDSTISKLLEHGLITESQTEEVAGLSTMEFQSEVAPALFILLQLENIKMFGEPDPNYAQFFTNRLGVGVTNWDTLKVGLLDYLNHLRTCGLVNDRLFPKVAGLIDQQQIDHRIPLLLFTLQLVEQDKRMAPQTLGTFASGLQEHAICTGDNLVRLNEVINQRAIENPIEFLKYCDRSRLFELANYSEDPDEYLEKIHQQTSSLVEGLAFEDFTYIVETDKVWSNQDYKSYNVIVSLRCNGRLYKQKSFYSPLEKRNDPRGMNYFGKIGTQAYYKVFNKILADNQSPYRLHMVSSSVNNVADYSKYGIIALTKTQADYLHKGGSYFRPSNEDFSANLTSSKIEEAIAEYEKAGLFSHLNGEEIAKAKEAVWNREHSSFLTVLAPFPKVLLIFDTELGNLTDPYAELVGWYADISRGAFHPSNISDDFNLEENEYCTLQFDLNGKHYSQQLRIQSDWIDADFFAFMDEVIEENNLDGSFHLFDTGGQDVAILFLTTEQNTYLRENGLLE